MNNLPTRLSAIIDDSPEYEIRYTPDATSRTVRAIKVPREKSTNAPARPQDRSFRCAACQDRGLITYHIERPNYCKCCPEGAHLSSSLCRCYCAKGEARPGWIPTYLDIFGSWPVSVHASITAPSKPDPEPDLPQTVIPFRQPPRQEEPAYQPPPPEPWTGTVVEELDP